MNASPSKSITNGIADGLRVPASSKMHIANGGYSYKNFDLSNNLSLPTMGIASLHFPVVIVLN